MKVIVSSLKNAIERRFYMESVLGSQEIKFEFNDSVSHLDLISSELKLVHIFSPQAIANFKTHVKAIEKSREEWCLILEDDATPISGAMDKIKNLLDKNVDFDILFVGWIAGFQSNIKEIDKDFIFLERFWGTHSYIVNPKSVDKVLSVIGEPTNHIDKRISDLVRKGEIRGIFSREKIFNQNKEFKTQIPKK